MLGCCGPCPATNASASVRSSESNRSGWSTSAPRSKPAATILTLRDLRFARPVEHYLRTVRPRVVGVACMHALEIVTRSPSSDACVALRPTRHPRRWSLCRAYPQPFFTAYVNAICLGDGESVRAAAGRCIGCGAPLSGVPGLCCRMAKVFSGTQVEHPNFSLDDVPARRGTWCRVGET